VRTGLLEEKGRDPLRNPPKNGGGDSKSSRNLPSHQWEQFGEEESPNV
jgi:hypothetical protein